MNCISRSQIYLVVEACCTSQYSFGNNMINNVMMVSFIEYLLCAAAVAAAKSLQSCPTLCDPIDGSPPGSPVPGILQARTLEWVAISFSNAWKWKVKGKSLSHVQLLATPRTTAHQAPPSMGFSRQEYWSGVLLPSLAASVKSLLKQKLSGENQNKINTAHKQTKMNLALFCF